MFFLKLFVSTVIILLAFVPAAIFTFCALLLDARGFITRFKILTPAMLFYGTWQIITGIVASFLLYFIWR